MYYQFRLDEQSDIACQAFNRDSLGLSLWSSPTLFSWSYYTLTLGAGRDEATLHLLRT